MHPFRQTKSTARVALAVGIATALMGCRGGSDSTLRPSEDAGTEDGFHDPLAMPEEPTLSVDSFNRAETCEPCHSQHYREWKSSMHAYAMVDPVFRAMTEVRQRDYDGAQDQFCTQCHSAIATRGGEIVDNFSFEELSPTALEGITCEACHKVSGLERTKNSGHVLEPEGPMQGPIRDPARTGGHEAEYNELMDDPEFCAGCHDVVEVSGLELERPYEEWLESPAEEEGQSCQRCHMPASVGRAADDGPKRAVHSHRFVGVDLPLSEGFISEREEQALRRDVAELLEGSAELTLEAPERVDRGSRIDLLATVTNQISGHNLPTGTTFIREIWLEVVVRDAEGQVLFETGTLDDNGDLRDYFSELDPYGDHDLVAFNSRLIGPDGRPVIFSWRAVEHRLNTIEPLKSRTSTFFVPTEEAADGPLQIDARLRFRTHPPYLLRRLGLEHLLERVETYDIDTESLRVQLDEP